MVCITNDTTGEKMEKIIYKKNAFAYIIDAIWDRQTSDKYPMEILVKSIKLDKKSFDF